MKMKPPATLTLIGAPCAGAVVLIGDHASAAIPKAEGNLGLAPQILSTHIALDIGVAEVAHSLWQRLPQCWAMCARWSRLLVALNRETDHPQLIPTHSDGVAIPDNIGLSTAAREARIDQYYRPYHAAVAALLAAHRPALIVSLHSFTPQLASRSPEYYPHAKRIWDLGLLYNQDDRLVATSQRLLSADGWLVGDQQPYSGRLLNTTMNRHAEANHIPYITIEMRQDHSGNPSGQAALAKSLAALLSVLLDETLSWR